MCVPGSSIVLTIESIVNIRIYYGANTKCAKEPRAPRPQTSPSERKTNANAKTAILPSLTISAFHSIFMEKSACDQANVKGKAHLLPFFLRLEVSAGRHNLVGVKSH